ncbi:hypothetical protein [Pseudomonas sp. MWU13-2105]|uniref:hypothetical protein n=1 Tax=Pseudomonas sp. MWU13-2105 TaxID=2935074 RepID=UPI00200CA342|nr:hypothetical protein [Pseudomonas sp. MWU13-2105]
MILFDSLRVPDPLYELVLYLNTYHEEKLEKPKLTFLLKNIETNFRKLFYSTCLLNKFQSDSDLLKKYDQTRVVSTQIIEYCYYKISTIWDISYEISKELMPVRGKINDRYDYLEAKFLKYVGVSPSLNLEWYKKINNIRNRIVHGGINVMPFHDVDDRGDPRIFFQAYNLDLVDLTPQSPYYTYPQRNCINFADNYFALYTHLLYSYLLDFFKVILSELCEKYEHDISDLSDPQEFAIFESQVAQMKSWSLADTSVFKTVTDNMIYLSLNDGRVKESSMISFDVVSRYYDVFPFSLMKYIAEPTVAARK